MPDGIFGDIGVLSRKREKSALRTDGTDGFMVGTSHAFCVTIAVVLLCFPSQNYSADLECSAN